MKDVIIYGLVDPRTDHLRYVGKTTRGLEKRLSCHLVRTNLTPKRHSSRWLAGMVSSGVKPEIFEIETIEAGGDWQDAERFWIAYFRCIGADLTNIADGGEGVSGYKFPEWRRQFMRDKFKGRVFDDEWKAKISAAKKGKPGKPQPKEVVEARMCSIRISVSRKIAARTHCTRGHELSTGNMIFRDGAFRGCRCCKKIDDLESRNRLKPPRKTREEISASLKLSMARPEVKVRMSEAQKHRHLDPEYRERHAAARRGKASTMRGDASPNAKLDWDKVAEIRRRCAAGEYRRVLAEEFGVSPAVLDRIIWNKTWKVDHMPEAMRIAA